MHGVRRGNVSLAYQVPVSVQCHVQLPLWMVLHDHHWRRLACFASKGAVEASSEDDELGAADEMNGSFGTFWGEAVTMAAMDGIARSLTKKGFFISVELIGLAAAQGLSSWA